MKKILQLLFITIPYLANSQSEIRGVDKSGYINVVIYPCDSIAIVTINRQDNCPIDILAIKGDVTITPCFSRVKKDGNVAVVFADGRVCFVWDCTEIVNESYLNN